MINILEIPIEKMQRNPSDPPPADLSLQNQQLVRQCSYEQLPIRARDGKQTLQKVNWVKLAVRVTWSSTPCMWQTVSFI